MVVVMVVTLLYTTGMVAISPKSNQPVACQYFQATVCVLFHPTEIVRGFRTTVHIGNIRQTAVIEGMNPVEGMKSNDQRSVMFRLETTPQKRFLIISDHNCRFIKNPEFVKIGARILFREGRTKGIGTVTQVFPFEYQKEADR